jgi:hypothetical protein
MSDTPGHRELDELVPAAALEILEGEELQRVLDHARECGDCARLLQSYREVVASLGSALPAQPLPAARSARLRARLLARARGSSPAGDRELAGRARRSRLTMVDRWAGWAVAAGLAGILLVHHSVHRPVAYGWLVSGALILVVLALAVYLRVQRGRVAALEERLSSVEKQSTTDVRPVAPE